MTDTVFQLTAEESAELLLVLNDVGLTRYPRVQRIRERLKALIMKPHPGPTLSIMDQPPHSTSVTTLATPPLAVPSQVPRRPPSLDDSSQVPDQPAVDRESTMTDKDREFCLALHKFRRDVMQARFGIAIMHNLGPGMIMGDIMLERIAECARAHKLRNLDDLYAETQWHETRQLGDQVLELVSKYYPHPTESSPLVTLADSDESITIS